MDILKKDSCSLVLLIVVIGAVILPIEDVSFADTSTAARTLAATYNLGHNIMRAEAKSVSARLEKVLTDCKDSNLAFRLKYRIGMIYFKGGMADDAISRFLQIANNSDCSELTRVCSLNMIGQISRMKGRDKEALDAFNQLANLLEQRLAVDKKNPVNPALMKLLCSALFSRAEIYQMQKDYTASICEYDRLIHILDRNKKEQLSQYVPLASDRISQLCLREKDISRYIKIAETLSTEHPEYYRTPVVKFEIEAVKFLKSVSANLEFAHGSLTAPVQLITYLKDTRDKTSAQQIVDKLARLCKDCPGVYAGILLNYHYACLLDALGRKDKAVEILARISSNNTVNAANKSRTQAPAGAIREYAEIQRAIMLGERADYRQALLMLGSLQTQPAQSHISNLAKSVAKSIEILKREVPKNDNK